MKKSLIKHLILLGLVVCVSFVTCAPVNAKSSKETTEQKIYRQLNDAYERCDKVANGIDGAWSFAIYSSDDYSELDGEMLSDFASKSGVPKKKIKPAIKKLYGYTNSVKQFVTLRSSAGAVGVVLQYNTDNKNFSKIKSDLKNAKANIKKLGKKSEYYKIFKSFYKYVDKYYKFVNDPSGSYIELGDTLYDLTDPIEDCLEDLEFDFGD